MNINEDGHQPHGWHGFDGDQCIKCDSPTGELSLGTFLPLIFFLFCREQPVTISAIHKATGLMVPGCSMI